ncbi:MAG: UDP-N-acetylglucosamine 2-epimerase, partial [Desulfobacterales bacterium]
MPEEINRICTDHISALLFCPTETAVANLKKEGITNGVFKVGDVMFDAFVHYRDLAQRKSTILADLKLEAGCYCLATLHRQENTDNFTRLSNIFRAFFELATAEWPFIVPIHPRTNRSLKRLYQYEQVNSFVRLVPPVGYLDMIALEANARVILTDSGGIQKEAYFSQVPCVTLRHETEWLETLHCGWNYLGGTEAGTIAEAFERATKSIPRSHFGLYGEGKAGEKMVRHITGAE